MRNVLADLAVESEAATTLAMRVAGAFDRAPGDPAEAALPPAGHGRGQVLGVQAGARRWPPRPWSAWAATATWRSAGMPRLYREAPLNGIWEGSGNVKCLDVLRALERSPESLAALFAEIREARGADHRLDTFAMDLRKALDDPAEAETQARRIVERLALALQASLLIRHSPPDVADAFVASRLAGDAGRAFGTLPAGTDFGAILERAAPPIT